MFFSRPELTRGSRPELASDEDLLLVLDNVGLYEGKYKIVACQKGHAYLTSHRICYVDDTEPKTNSIAIELKDVERHEAQAAFLRSSAKVIIYPKPAKRGYGSLRHQAASSSLADRGHPSSSPVTRVSSPFRDVPVRAVSPQVDRGAWICPICSFSNPVPLNFNPVLATDAFPIPPCLNCGIQPEFKVLLKAAISASSRAPRDFPEASTSRSFPSSQQRESGPSSFAGDSISCPRCTFKNHASMRNCEVCGAPLPSHRPPPTAATTVAARPASPGPEVASLDLDHELDDLSIKFSFRAGGDKAFYEKLKGAMVQRKWLLQYAPPLPKPEPDLDDLTGMTESLPENRSLSTPVGIAGLQQRGAQKRHDNETTLGTAFSDLEALMSSAKDIVALAEKFAAESGQDPSNGLAAESAAALGMIATKDTVSEKSNSLYISELSRNLAEYVLDDGRGILRANGGIVSLIDLWAIVNRARNGVELVSPSDFHSAAEAWDRLQLPLRLRQFKSGLLVVQPRYLTDEKTIQQLLSWLESLQASPPKQQPAWDWTAFGCGVTAQEAASHFGWKLGVAIEELEMAEEHGVLCREEGIEGLKFWLNRFSHPD